MPPSILPNPAKTNSSANSPLASTDRKETVLMLDWDDTLLCTSDLGRKGLKLDTPHHNIDATTLKELKALETAVLALITAAFEHGVHTHLVTNAEHGWVELSAQKFLPSIVPHLAALQVVSARSAYEDTFPDAPLKWKYYAMHEKLSDSNLFTTDKKNLKRQVISFGDSHVEREAIRALTSGYQKAGHAVQIKTVKFEHTPTIEQLQRQVELITQQFKFIHDQEGDLDLQLTVTMTPPNPMPTPAVSVPLPCTTAAASSSATPASDPVIFVSKPAPTATTFQRPIPMRAPVRPAILAATAAAAAAAFSSSTPPPLSVTPLVKRPDTPIPQATKEVDNADTQRKKKPKAFHVPQHGSQMLNQFKKIPLGDLTNLIATTEHMPIDGNSKKRKARDVSKIVS